MPSADDQGYERGDEMNLFEQGGAAVTVRHAWLLMGFVVSQCGTLAGVEAPGY